MNTDSNSYQRDSEEDFLFWKEWSDADYHEEEKERHSFSDNTLYIEGLSEEILTTESPKDRLFNALTETEKKEIQSMLLGKFETWLTETTKRRMRLYFVEGKTLREIAILEGVASLSVYESILSGKEKFLKKISKTP